MHPGFPQGGGLILRVPGSILETYMLCLLLLSVMGGTSLQVWAGQLSAGPDGYSGDPRTSCQWTFISPFGHPRLDISEAMPRTVFRISYWHQTARSSQLFRFPSRVRIPIPFHCVPYSTFPFYSIVLRPAPVWRCPGVSILSNSRCECGPSVKMPITLHSITTLALVKK